MFNDSTPNSSEDFSCESEEDTFVDVIPRGKRYSVRGPLTVASVPDLVQEGEESFGFTNVSSSLAPRPQSPHSNMESVTLFANTHNPTVLFPLITTTNTPVVGTPASSRPSSASIPGESMITFKHSFPSVGRSALLPFRIAEGALDYSPLLPTELSSALTASVPPANLRVGCPPRASPASGADPFAVDPAAGPAGTAVLEYLRKLQRALQSTPHSLSVMQDASLGMSPAAAPAHKRSARVSSPSRHTRTCTHITPTSATVTPTPSATAAASTAPTLSTFPVPHRGTPAEQPIGEPIDPELSLLFSVRVNQLIAPADVRRLARLCRRAHLRQQRRIHQASVTQPQQPPLPAVPSDAPRARLPVPVAPVAGPFSQSLIHSRHTDSRHTALRPAPTAPAPTPTAQSSFSSSPLISRRPEGRTREALPAGAEVDPPRCPRRCRGAAADAHGVPTAAVPAGTLLYDVMHDDGPDSGVAAYARARGARHVPAEPRAARVPRPARTTSTRNVSTVDLAAGNGSHPSTSPRSTRWAPRAPRARAEREAAEADEIRALESQLWASVETAAVEALRGVLSTTTLAHAAARTSVSAMSTTTPGSCSSSASYTSTSTSTSASVLASASAFACRTDAACRAMGSAAAPHPKHSTHPTHSNGGGGDGGARADPDAISLPRIARSPPVPHKGEIADARPTPSESPTAPAAPVARGTHLAAERYQRHVGALGTARPQHAWGMRVHTPYAAPAVQGPPALPALPTLAMPVGVLAAQEPPRTRHPWRAAMRVVAVASAPASRAALRLAALRGCRRARAQPGAPSAVLPLAGPATDPSMLVHAAEVRARARESSLRGARQMQAATEQRAHEAAVAAARDAEAIFVHSAASAASRECPSSGEQTSLPSRIASTPSPAAARTCMSTEGGLAGAADSVLAIEAAGTVVCGVGRTDGTDAHGHPSFLGARLPAPAPAPAPATAPAAAVAEGVREVLEAAPVSASACAFPPSSSQAPSAAAWGVCAGCTGSPAAAAPASTTAAPPQPLGEPLGAHKAHTAERAGVGVPPSRPQRPQSAPVSAPAWVSASVPIRTAARTSRMSHTAAPALLDSADPPPGSAPPRRTRAHTSSPSSPRPSAVVEVGHAGEAGKAGAPSGEQPPHSLLCAGAAASHACMALRQPALLLPALTPTPAARVATVTDAPRQGTQRPRPTSPPTPGRHSYQQPFPPQPGSPHAPVPATPVPATPAPAAPVPAAPDTSRAESPAGLMARATHGTQRPRSARTTHAHDHTHTPLPRPRALARTGNACNLPYDPCDPYDLRRATGPSSPSPPSPLPSRTPRCPSYRGAQRGPTAPPDPASRAHTPRAVSWAAEQSPAPGHASARAPHHAGAIRTHARRDTVFGRATQPPVAQWPAAPAHSSTPSAGTTSPNSSHKSTAAPPVDSGIGQVSAAGSFYSAHNCAPGFLIEQMRSQAQTPSPLPASRARLAADDPVSAVHAPAHSSATLVRRYLSTLPARARIAAVYDKYNTHTHSLAYEHTPLVVSGASLATTRPERPVLELDAPPPRSRSRSHSCSHSLALLASPAPICSSSALDAHTSPAGVRMSFVAHGRAPVPAPAAPCPSLSLSRAGAHVLIPRSAAHATAPRTDATAAYRFLAPDPSPAPVPTSASAYSSLLLLGAPALQRGPTHIPQSPPPAAPGSGGHAYVRQATLVAYTAGQPPDNSASASSASLNAAGVTCALPLRVSGLPHTPELPVPPLVVPLPRP